MPSVSFIFSMTWAGAGRSAVLAKLAMFFSENNDRADPAPEHPGAAEYCDHCGGVEDLIPGVDGPDFPELVCRDLDRCLATRESRLLRPP